MRNVGHLILLIPFCLLAACGSDEAQEAANSSPNGSPGEPGERGSRLLSELEAQDLQDLCANALEFLGGESAVVDCGDGDTLTLKDSSECVADVAALPPCTTANLYDQCLRSLDCAWTKAGEDFTPECAFILTGQCTTPASSANEGGS